MHIEADSMDNLVFLNSQTSVVPSGRNARRHAQAERARLLHPTKAQVGQSLVLDLGLTAPRIKLQSKRKRTLDRAIPKTALRAPSNPRMIVSCQPLADRSLLHAVWKTAMGHELQDVLIIAAHHVRRTTARLASLQPWRLAEMLRCRQWAILPVRQLQVSEPVTGAYAFLAMRLRHVVFGGGTSVETLSGHDWALRSLRSALCRPSGPHHDGLILASRLLAIAELLELQSSTNWYFHTTGTAALMRAVLGSRDTRHSPDLSDFVPTLLEAFLNHEDLVVPNAPWQALIRPLIGEHVRNAALADDVASQLVNVAALIAETNTVMKRSVVQVLNPKSRLFLLSRATDARKPMKRIIMSLQLQDETHAEILGLCLAALLGIDKVVDSLQPTPAGIGSSYEADSIELGIQIMQDDLKRSAKSPAASLIAAFQRHGAARLTMASAT
ncbi:hypothetical protein LTR97_000666 [Elasticomyces elasticus]|uniref:Uncharacterized protein n=1 Tax=Elasticomyces elasticus TaxID=574655 RepID=A0AAN7WJ98_9PEZI|nr:hypothetical protein LTR97_000666 [Elasticomyces elasticus]